MRQRRHPWRHPTLRSSGRSRILPAVIAGVLITLAGTAGRVERSEAAWVASTSEPGNSFSTKPLWGTPLYSWGNGSNGRNGTLLQTSSSSTAVRAIGPEQWSAVDAGYKTACAITTGGALYCWGYNTDGQVGNGTISDQHEAVAVAAGTTWTAVDTGYHDTCAIRSSDGTLWCWGYNLDGEVGNNSSASPVTVPTEVSTSGTTSWSSVTVGQYFGCGIKTDGTLWCWGLNDHGQLGQGDTTGRLVPTQVGAVTSWRSVSAAWTSVCATRTDDTVWCWGDRSFGQVGDNLTTPDATGPVQIGGSVWSSTSAGADHHCGLRTDGTIWCWGYGGSGDLGNGAIGDQHVPVQESTLATDWAALASMAYASCATKTTGALYCWGQNAVGQLGDGSTTDRYSPVASGSATDWVMPAGGGYDWFCAIRSIGAGLWCQGNDDYMQLGHYWAHQAGAPTPLGTGTAAPTDWSTGDTGWEGGCGIRGDGTLWCWGTNSNGEVGAGDSVTDHPWPTQEAGGATTWTAVSVGSWTVCGLRGTALYCWGYGGFGQFGTGSTADQHTPTAGPAGTWTSVSVGETHTCGIKSDGTLWCWGDATHGQLGQGNTTSSTTPVSVSAANVSTWASVSAGYYETCAIAATGTAAGGLFCWGLNDQGQVGNDNAPTDATSPVRLGTTTWSVVSVGRQHVCGITTAGALDCWGYNFYGQLGQGGSAGTPTSLAVPTTVGASTTWTDVAAAWGFSCATRSDHTLWCWGRDDYGNLGDRDSSGTVTTPQQVPGTTAYWVQTHASALSTVAGTTM